MQLPVNLDQSYNGWFLSFQQVIRIRDTQRGSWLILRMSFAIKKQWFRFWGGFKYLKYDFSLLSAWCVEIIGWLPTGNARLQSINGPDNSARYALGLTISALSQMSFWRIKVGMSVDNSALFSIFITPQKTKQHVSACWQDMANIWAWGDILGMYVPACCPYFQVQNVHSQFAVWCQPFHPTPEPGHYYPQQKLITFNSVNLPYQFPRCYHWPQT